MFNYKKRYISLLVLCFAVTLFLSGIPAFGAASAEVETSTYLSLQIDNPNVYNGIYKMAFPLNSEETAVRPILYNERTMLPMRAVVSVLNFDGPMFYDIEWDGDDNTAFLYLLDDSDEDFFQPIALFQIDNTTAVFYKDGVPTDVTIPVAPTLINDRTYLPLRAITDALMINEDGYVTGIEWVDAKQGIVICLYDARPSAVTFPDGSSAKLFG